MGETTSNVQPCGIECPGCGPTLLFGVDCFTAQAKDSALQSDLEAWAAENGSVSISKLQVEFKSTLTHVCRSEPNVRCQRYRFLGTLISIHTKLGFPAVMYQSTRSLSTITTVETLLKA